VACVPPPQAYYAAKGIQLRKGVLAKELQGDAAGKVSGAM